MTTPIRMTFDQVEPHPEVTDKEVEEILHLYNPEDPDLSRAQVRVRRLAMAVKEARAETGPSENIEKLIAEWMARPAGDDEFDADELFSEATQLLSDAEREVTRLRKETRTMMVQITDEWFDGDHPNPLHPKGATLDPVMRDVWLNGIQAFVGDWVVTDSDGNLYLAFSRVG